MKKITDKDRMDFMNKWIGRGFDFLWMPCDDENMDIRKAIDRAIKNGSKPKRKIKPQENKNVRMD